MKKVLVLYYSQNGQLKNVLDNFTSKLGDEEIQVDMRSIKPKISYPFPWPFYRFFAVHEGYPASREGLNGRKGQ